MYKMVLWAMLISMPGSLMAQTKELHIGDTLPPVPIQCIVDRELRSMMLSDLYREKPIILSFWATWCGACTPSIYKADSVIKGAGTAITLVPVTYERADEVKAFAPKNKYLSRLSLPHVVSDTILVNGLFKFGTVPHEVWISKDGIVQAISFPDDISTLNVKEFAAGKPLDLEVKNVKMYNPDKEPFPQDEKSLLVRSLLTPHNDGYNSMHGTNFWPFEKVESRYFSINKSIYGLYTAVYNYGGGLIPPGRIEVHVRDSFILSTNFNGERQSRLTRKERNAHLYCYEFRTKDSIDRRIFFKMMLDDLNRYFPYTGSIEKRARDCWVIVSRGKKPTKSNGAYKLSWESGKLKTLQNVTVQLLAGYLNLEMDLPVQDESGVFYGIDIELENDIDPETGRLRHDQVRASLNKYGLNLVKKKRKTDILVIRDKEKFVSAR